ncbi:hypothetical protein PHYBLDRAFT_140223 [Phycomyces blakesleeanus NRRL 1555(-)]|uniref:Uncharacterized protein n=1 Tax=Phycomyces blakesleeanus (strain ATCC 8743b / DSM 1359 / FGSC 10004 / NBRC 33097 / NRRL 1555) TaxID=763407 RepID=A0A162V5Z3_PHYB8|nr:hypothetical protein PHYBLDRAFT_140223 [Phycomyces blakesleeanus NRRL 1555(-)]OAD80222.1 hypothetical protein PHYBLDRAFT_140223 [Phycomyces blakesleeanus NRRL 1555(-)]|eukprot:XP_018298262.1 hypothetical protein PHYBLDRAFT_140223 [Phycomyces blakesleeanus NRRL 1555(-)]
MHFSFFHLLVFPEFDNTNWDQIELFHASKKVTICGPVESKCCAPPGNVVPLILPVHFIGTELVIETT